MNWKTLAALISKVENIDFEVSFTRSVGGGCINDAWHISDSQQAYFVKVNKSCFLAMFETEKLSLEEICKTGNIRVPRPLICTEIEDYSYLVMEYISLSNVGDHRKLGQQLAALHKHTADNFGWDQDNTIGTTPQLNSWKQDWATFWRENRLGYQLDLARNKGLPNTSINICENLISELDKLFQSYTPAASLLHGDLWSGNVAYDEDANPVIFDPACYYGDREADIAMTELFGGFSSEFYNAYNDVWPLDAGYKVRKDLYNLYHILNHFNLFGGNYAAQVKQLSEKLLTEL